LLGGWDNQQPIERQRLKGVLRNEDMANMRRIETAAEEPQLHGRVS
jgi:hypothetical protein